MYYSPGPLLSSDVRDAGVPDERHPSGEAHGQPDASLPGHAGGCGARGRVPQPLVRRAGRLLHWSGHRHLPGEETAAVCRALHSEAEMGLCRPW